jgi:hypothetical protein
LMVRWPRWLRHEGKHHSNSEEIWAESMMVELDICEIRGKISHMLHGAGIFTYKTGWFLGQMLVNIPYMEHMGMGIHWNIINGGFNRKITKKEWWWIWFSVMYFWCLSHQDVQRRDLIRQTLKVLGLQIWVLSLVVWYIEQQQTWGWYGWSQCEHMGN